MRKLFVLVVIVLTPTTRLQNTSPLCTQSNFSEINTVIFRSRWTKMKMTVGYDDVYGVSVFYSTIVQENRVVTYRWALHNSLQSKSITNGILFSVISSVALSTIDFFYYYPTSHSFAGHLVPVIIFKTAASIFNGRNFGCLGCLYYYYYYRLRSLSQYRRR